MRIPVLDVPKVAPRALPTPYDTAKLDTGGETLAKGIEQGVGAAADALQHLQDRANAVNVADALTQFERHETTLMAGGRQTTGPVGAEPSKLGVGPTEGVMEWQPYGDNKVTPPPLMQAFSGDQRGFLSTRGREAFEQSAGVLDELERRRQAIRDGLANDAQKALFERKSAQRLELTRRRVEEHVSQQRRAVEDQSMKDRADETESFAARFPDQDADINVRVQDTSDYLRALDPVGGEAKAKALKAKVTALRIEQFLANHNPDAADKLYQRDGADLGITAPEYAKKIEAVRLDVRGEKNALEFINNARDPLEPLKVDRTKATAQLGAIQDVKEREETEKHLEARLTAVEKDWKERVNQQLGIALKSYADNGERLTNVPPGVRDWLTKNAPEKWVELLSKERYQLSLLRQISEADRKRLADEEKQRRETAQSAAYVRLVVDMAENKDKYRDMSEAEFYATNALELGKERYAAAGSRLAALKKDDPGKSIEFKGWVDNEVKGDPRLFNDKTGKELPTARTFRVLMNDMRFQFLEHNKREPNLEEIKKMRETVWTEVAKHPTLETLPVVGPWFREREPKLKQRGEVQAPEPTTRTRTQRTPTPAPATGGPPQPGREPWRIRLKELQRQNPGAKLSDLKQQLRDEHLIQ